MLSRQFVSRRTKHYGVNSSLDMVDDANRFFFLQLQSSAACAMPKVGDLCPCFDLFSFPVRNDGYIHTVLRHVTATVNAHQKIVKTCFLSCKKKQSQLQNFN